ncbi:TetR/AcrR family transcriptional regulator [Pseudoalteromonas phenolica]|uniref:acrylate utilization transcriptional regulator AcuR n=1 Tax=Pseudoalteromonas phenolica TaxID=161398 RepID=UPI00110A987B|nr:TetR/AcrR family transcriptional regulator [Pseudoalteromonas phenolica]TMO58288.1 TetR family transcriptional regulator [Pseudoalteromonas phenolica]
MIEKASKPRRGRPPKVARENQDTRAELIRAGLEQLTESGFAASGIEQILKRVGVPKGSFYHYFSSKEAFGLAVLESYAAYFLKKLSRHLAQSDETPLSRLSNFVEDAKSGMQKHNFKRGCLVGNLGQEVDLLPISFRKELVAIFETWQCEVAACLEEAKKQGQVSQNADCALLAEYFWVGWEGAVSRARLEASAKPLDNYFKCFVMGIS